MIVAMATAIMFYNPLVKGISSVYIMANPDVVYEDTDSLATGFLK